jgi:hypothetical protein
MWRVGVTTRAGMACGPVTATRSGSPMNKTVVVMDINSRLWRRRSPDDRAVMVIGWHICPQVAAALPRETGAPALSRDGPSSPTVASLPA